MDLWEQPGPADFSAGYKPRSRQRQKRTWLKGKWGFAFSEDCFKPSKLQKTVAKRNSSYTQVKCWERQDTPNPNCIFPEWAARQCCQRPGLKYPAVMPWQLVGGGRPDGQVLGGRREPRARPPWRPRSSHPWDGISLPAARVSRHRNWCR